jgi:hypothetical protein
MEVSDRWLSPGQCCSKVRVYDGGVYVLRHDEAAGEWEITLFSQRPRAPSLLRPAGQPGGYG